MIRSFKQLEDYLRKKNRSARIALCCCDDLSSLKALALAQKKGLLASSVLIGDIAKAKEYIASTELELNAIYIEEKDEKEAVYRGIEQIRSGNADILMKGSLHSEPYLQAICDLEKGIAVRMHSLTSVMLLEYPEEKGIVFATGSPFYNLKLDLPAKLTLLMETVRYGRYFLDVPVRVAALTGSEKIDPNIQSSIDAYGLSNMRFAECTIDGPVTLGSALSNDEEGRIITDYDVLFACENGMNQTIQRALRLSGEHRLAGILIGTKCPAIITSRVDSVCTRYNSILAALLRQESLQLTAGKAADLSRVE